MNYKSRLAEAINKELNINLENIEEFIEIPFRRELGDFTLPCFKLSKIIRKSPNIIVKELKNILEIEGFEKIEVLDTYINFFIDKEKFIYDTSEKIIEEGISYGNYNRGKGKVIYINYFLDYTIKLLNIEQAVKLIIGNSICNLLQRSGYIVKKIKYSNHLDSKSSKLFHTYNRFKGREELNNNRIDILIRELTSKDIMSEIDNSKLIMLDRYNLSPFIISNEDKILTYPTINLLSIIDINNKYNFYKYICITDQRNKTEFKKIFSVLELLEYKWRENCIHAEIGLIKFKDIYIGDRSGNRIIFNDLITEAKIKILNIINISKIKLEDKEKIAENIAMEAIKFICLRNSKKNNILFDWKQIWGEEEGSYLYLQCSYVKAINILSLYKEDNKSDELYKLSLEEEFELAKYLEEFNLVINKAIENLEPSVVLSYIVEVTKKLNNIIRFYNINNIKEEKLIDVRTKIIKSSCQVISNGLNLIGIDVIEREDLLHELIINNHLFYK